MAYIEPENFVGIYNKAYKSKPVNKEELKQFITDLNKYLEDIDTHAGEHTIKGVFRDTILKNYKCQSEVNGVDLAIIKNKKRQVIFEFKTIENKAEMPQTKDDINKKALHEIIKYYYTPETLEERYLVKNIVITDTKRFFFFNPAKLDNKKLEKICENYKKNEYSNPNSETLYKLLKEAIERDDIQFDYTFIELPDVKKFDINRDTLGNEDIRILYKLLHPDFLLREFTPKDSNELNSRFYNELLYIIGLEESDDGKVKKIRLSDTENTLSYKIRKHLDGCRDQEEVIRMIIIWLNRILFLKLFESQLVDFNKKDKDKDYTFLNKGKIKNFTALNELFFNVLGKPISSRGDNKYDYIPYLNSSLFERTSQEQNFGNISNLPNDGILRRYSGSVLSKFDDHERTLLEYLLDFLDAYSFNSFESDGREIINSAVLGLIFEKLNGYKEGSFFTPGYITEYMAEKAINKLVLDTFNKKLDISPKFESLEELKKEIQFNRRDEEKIALYTKIFESLRICDIACGSGHFLVSSLNQLLYLKSFLGLLPINNFIEIHNDSLVVFESKSRIFSYKKGDTATLNIQKLLFEEKAKIISNCLFGVDINETSAEICKLRLWIELLKSAYYIDDDGTEMQLLPNIDINVKSGDSLISCIKPEIGKAADINPTLLSSNTSIAEYRDAVFKYKASRNKADKAEIVAKIENIKKELFFLWNNKVKREDNSVEWMLDFPELLDNDGKFLGFDLIIGNPPYIQEKGNKSIFEKVLKTPFGKAYKDGKMNYCYFFFHRALDLLKQDGILAFIVSNYFLSAEGAKTLKERIVNSSKIITCVDFNKTKVFESANVQSMILILENSQPNNNSFNAYIFNRGVKRGSIYKILYDIDSSDCVKKLLVNNQLKIISDEIINFEMAVAENAAILEKINSYKSEIKLFEVEQGIFENPSSLNSKNIKKLPGTSFPKGTGIFVLTKDESANLPFSESERLLLKPYYRPEDIDRYYSDRMNSCELLYLTPKTFTNTSDYPNIIHHLTPFKPIMEERRETREGTTEWCHLHWPRDVDFEVEKIVYPQMVSKPIFSYVDRPYYVCMSVNVIYAIKKINLKALTCILNSEISQFWFLLNAKNRGVGIDIGVKTARRFPVNLEILENREVLSLSSEIINSVQSKTDYSVYEQNLNSKLYELYKISAEEEKWIKDFLASKLK